MQIDDIKQKILDEISKTEILIKEYKELTKPIAPDDAIRAVASANGANAISIFVPCHRIIGSKGELTGYAGGLNTKRRLLQLEKNMLEPMQLKLFKYMDFESGITF